jgi:hypothetical protein
MTTQSRWIAAAIIIALGIIVPVRAQPSFSVAAWLSQADVRYPLFKPLPGVDDQQWHVIAVCDLTGDGYADIVWQNVSTQQVVGWSLDANGTLVGSWFIEGFLPDLSSTLSWHVEGCADVNGDGRADLIWRAR